MRKLMSRSGPKLFLAFSSLIFEACIGAGQINFQSSIDMQTRVTECRVLDAKVTDYGSQGAAGGILSGGAGLAAALPDNAKARRWVGALSLVSGIYGAVTAFLATRNAERFSSRSCGIILGPDLDNQKFKDALAARRDSVFGAAQRKSLEDSIYLHIVDSVRIANPKKP